jgi:hypothetical protein
MELKELEIPTAVILDDIAEERRRQTDKWGTQSHPNISEPTYEAFADSLRTFKIIADNYKAMNDSPTEGSELDWTGILLEEVYEALSEMGEENDWPLRYELIQVAAVVVAWIEDIDRRRLAGKHEMVEPFEVAPNKWASACMTCDYGTPVTTSSRVLDLIEKHENGDSNVVELKGKVYTYSRTQDGERSSYEAMKNLCPLTDHDDWVRTGWIAHEEEVA